jgi:hypothetical protein
VKFLCQMVTSISTVASAEMKALRHSFQSLQIPDAAFDCVLFFLKSKSPFIFHYCSHETRQDLSLFRSRRSYYDLVVWLHGYRRFGTTYRSHLQGSFEKSVANLHSKLLTLLIRAKITFVVLKTSLLLLHR